MRLIIHIGLNKAASTWIQHSLHHCNSGLLYYECVDKYFLCHETIGRYLSQEKQGEVIEFIQNYALKAKEHGAECAVISSEDIWHQLLFNPTAACTLEKARIILSESHQISTRYLIVTRDFKKWAYSHCMQIIRNNGGLSREILFDLFRSSITIAKFPVLSAQKLPKDSVDIVACDRGDFTNKLQRLISPLFKGLDSHINVSRKNQLACDILTGNLRLLYSFHRDLHPNDKACDELVDKFLDAWDVAMERSEMGYKAMIKYYDDIYFSILSEEIAHLEKEMSDNERCFWLAK